MATVEEGGGEEKEGVEVEGEDHPEGEKEEKNKKQEDTQAATPEGSEDASKLGGELETIYSDKEPEEKEGDVLLLKQVPGLRDLDTTDMEAVTLENAWTFYFDEGPPKGIKMQEFEKKMKALGSFNTVQDFWRFWNHVVDFEQLPARCNLRLFKHAIRPLWEDAANVQGGKFVIPCPKELTLKLWSEVVLLMIGEQLESADDICGVVLSVRPKMNTINIWNQSHLLMEDADAITDQLHELLNLDIDLEITYQRHQGSIDFYKHFRPRRPNKKGSRRGKRAGDKESKGAGGRNRSSSTTSGAESLISQRSAPTQVSEQMWGPLNPNMEDDERPDSRLSLASTEEAMLGEVHWGDKGSGLRFGSWADSVDERDRRRRERLEKRRKEVEGANNKSVEEAKPEGCDNITFGSFGHEAEDAPLEPSAPLEKKLHITFGEVSVSLTPAEPFNTPSGAEDLPIGHDTDAVSTNVGVSDNTAIERDNNDATPPTPTIDTSNTNNTANINHDHDDSNETNTDLPPPPSTPPPPSYDAPTPHTTTETEGERVITPDTEEGDFTAVTGARSARIRTANDPTTTTAGVVETSNVFAAMTDEGAGNGQEEATWDDDIHIRAPHPPRKRSGPAVSSRGKAGKRTTTPKTIASQEEEWDLLQPTQPNNGILGQVLRPLPIVLAAAVIAGATWMASSSP
eukprot:TRINITY_DN1576_c0_g1_i1.p1 TRINITY_DN1576_c0_g1~~TRINITY_DN1576_c0_g1_i1.p1  ORF type:complete len:727 (+),score=179.16 TRINITY_DN1576_c0_g1_i1:133-2181(+)